MARLRVAAVGLGWVALHRHIPVMSRGADFEIIGVIDRSPGRAQYVMRKYGFRHYAETADLASVDWLRDADAVTVATAPMSHYPVLRQAIELGKHVLTEKPFTMTVAEGEELVTLAKARGLQLAIVHNFQFARATKLLQRDIRKGLLGTLRSVKAVQFGNPRRRLPSWYEQLPLGLMYDESPHLLYLLRAVVGNMELVRSLTCPSTTGLNTPARLDAYFRAPGFRGPITMSCNFESSVSEWYLIVIGDERLGIIDVFRDIYICLPNDGRHRTATVFRTSISAIGQHLIQNFTSGIPHLAGKLFYGNEEVFHRFAQAIRGATEGLAPIGPESALAVLRLQHAIVDRQECVYDGGVLSIAT